LIERRFGVPDQGVSIQSPEMNVSWYIINMTPRKVKDESDY